METTVVIITISFVWTRVKQVTYCVLNYFGTFRNIQGPETIKTEQNEAIVDLCWQLSLKFGSPKAPIVGKKNAVQSE